MADLGTLRVTLVANLRKFVAGMKQGIASVKTFSAAVISSMKRATRAISRFVLSAARSLGAFAKKWVRRAIIAMAALGVAAIKWAADAEESENLVRESFGGMTDAVIVWSERLQKELGLDAIQLRKQAGFFNLLTLSMGATEQQAFKVSTSLTELAADMASFRNQSFEEIFNAMRSGMVGMTRPLQNLGINIKENAVDQLLLARGVDRTAESLTEQERVLARYIAILEATEKDTGDLAHTYDSFTNVIRVMVTNSKILARELGETLKKAITPLAIRMRDWLLNNRDDVAVWFEEVINKFMDFTSFFTGGTWESGIKEGLSLTVELFDAFGDTIWILMKDLFSNIGSNIIGWMQSSLASAGAKARFVDELFGAEGIGITDRLLGFATGGKRGVSKEKLAAINAEAQKLLETWKKSGDFAKDMGITLERDSKALEQIAIRFKQVGERFAETAAKGRTARAEQDKLFAEGQAARDAKNAKLRAESKARLAAALADANQQFDSLLAKNQAITEAVSSTWQDIGDTIKQIMTAANDNVKNAFADMLVGMATEMDNFGDFAKQFLVDLANSIARMQAELVAAKILGSAATGGLGGGDLLGNVLSFLGGNLGKQPTGFSGGGVVKPVYAATGFVAKGTDTVPAMLTPGEVVLPKEIVELIGNSGGSVTFNVNAIDAQNTAQWLNSNKRLIAGMVYDTSRGNNPASRRLGN